MAKAILKTSSLNDLLPLNAAQIKVLIAMADLCKNNHIEMNESNYEKIANLTSLQVKTVRNRIKDLVNNDIVAKAGTLSSYVIDPSILVVGNEQKALNHYQSAKKTSSEFKKGLGKEKLNARGDFDIKKLESEIESRRQKEDLELMKEAKERFASKED